MTRLARIAVVYYSATGNDHRHNRPICRVNA
jgi:hypothetical protein